MQQLSLESFLYEQYKIPKNKKLRLISFFSGYDSQSLGLKYANIPFEHYKTCEWAVNSIQALKDLHFGNDNFDYSANLSYNDILDYLYNKGISANYNEPMTFEQIKRKGEKWARNVYNNIYATKNLVNIQQVKGGDLGINECDKYEYLLTYSFPCITNDSLILTKNGYKQMKDVNVGELVLTKSNTWQKVAKKFDNGVHQTCFLNAMGFENIHCTLNHQFYVKTMYREWENNTRRYIRKFTEPKFKQTKDLTKNDYLGIPVINDEIEFYTDNLDFWFIVGMYLGDGWLSKNDNSILIACNDKKLDILSKKLDNFKWHKHKTRTCWKINIKNKNMREFLEKYIGTGSNFKRIPYEILALPKKYLKSFYEGYLSSDGCCIDNKRQFSSINRQLIYSISLIINKLFHRPTCIYKIKVKNKKIIENRIVNQKDWYQLRFNINNNKQDKAFYENGYIWYPFKKIELAEKENVYNMEIENDHSYIIQGCISKNCQDLSLAGVRKGMTKGSGTRSGMLWEVERILKECDTLPNILLMENVPQIHSQENKNDFILWQKELEKLGYRNYWEDLNAKDYLVPQNRNRTFMISILGDYFYEFPQKQPLTLKLKDLLEEQVDEKYYLSQKMLNCFMVDDTGGYPRKERFIKNITRQNQDVGNAVTTLAGSRPTDNFVIEGYGNKALDETLEQNDVQGGEFIDAYNRTVKKDVAGTITTRVSNSNCTFIAEKPKNETRCDELIESGSVTEGDIINHSRNNVPLNTEGVVPTLTTRADELGVVVVDLKRGYSCEVKEEKEDVDGIDIIGNYSKSNFNQTSIVNKNGIAPTVTENHGTITAIVESDGVMIPEATQKGYAIANDGDGVYINRPHQKRGVVQKGMIQTLKTQCNDIGVVVKEDVVLYDFTKSEEFCRGKRDLGKVDIMPTLLTQPKQGIYKINNDTPQLIGGIGEKNSNGGTQYYQQNRIYSGEGVAMCHPANLPSGSYMYGFEEKKNLRIRKLTSRECFRLMGVKDEDYEKIKPNQSESSLFHLAGDSIVVNVLSEIFKKII